MRVIWNPWQSNWKLRNMKNRSFEVLCHKQIWNVRRGSKEKSAMKHFLMIVMSATFGAHPEVHFLHAIYHFKSQEVKNPILQTVRDSELKRRSYSHCNRSLQSVAKSAFCCENFAAFLYSAMEFLLKFPDICDTLEAEHRKLKSNFVALRNQPFAAK